MAQSGLGHEGALASLTQMVQSQSVTIATNQVFLAAAALYGVAAVAIWLAPGPRVLLTPP